MLQLPLAAWTRLAPVTSRRRKLPQQPRPVSVRDFPVKRADLNAPALYSRYASAICSRSERDNIHLGHTFAFLVLLVASSMHVS